MPFYLSIDLELPSMASNLRAARIDIQRLDELDTRLERQMNGMLTLLDRLARQRPFSLPDPWLSGNPSSLTMASLSRLRSPELATGVATAARKTCKLQPSWFATAG